MELLAFACGWIHEVGTVVSHLNVTQFRLDGHVTSKLRWHASYYSGDSGDQIIASWEII